MMKTSVLFWNIWLNNQIGGPKHSTALLDELTELIRQYQPDSIGLSEVLMHVDTKTPFVLDHLRTLGYAYNHFASSSPLTEEWLIGTAICSKYKLTDKTDIILGNDIPAEHRAYRGWTHKSVAAQVEVSDDVSIGLVSAHLVHLRSYTLRSHYSEQKLLAQFIQDQSYAGGVIVGGDFNEPRWFPRSFKYLVRGSMHHKTGDLRNHTWHHNASPKTVVRANLDRLFWSKRSRSGLQLNEFRVLESAVSDHKPLYAVFAL